MRPIGRADLAELFGDLAREEQHHVMEVKELAQRILRRMPTLAVVFQ